MHIFASYENYSDDASEYHTNKHTIYNINTGEMNIRTVRPIQLRGLSFSITFYGCATVHISSQQRLLFFGGN